MAEHNDAAHHFGLTGWQQGLLVIGIFVGIILGGRVFVRPLFQVIARTKMREIFTATALLIVIGIAQLMSLIGMSAALGTFLAGVVLADNEYRHELEAEIEPFKGLLLGVFFISVGASIDFKVVLSQPELITGLVLLLVAVKMAILLGLAVAFGLSGKNRWTFTFALAQAGEFCFVLFSFASQNDILPPELTKPLVVVVALSMMLTPLLMIVNDKLIQPRFAHQQEKPPSPDVVDDGHTDVIHRRFWSIRPNH